MLFSSLFVCHSITTLLAWDVGCGPTSLTLQNDKMAPHLCSRLLDTDLMLPAVSTISTFHICFSDMTGKSSNDKRKLAAEKFLRPNAKNEISSLYA